MDALLRSMSRSQWLEWLEWMALRGPIGGSRTDFYTSYLAMHMGAQQGKEVSLRQYSMPWVRLDDLEQV